MTAIDTFPRKTALSVLIAYFSIIWLNEWHQYNFSRSPIVFPPVSNWLRDALIVALPVMLGVWAGISITRWLIACFRGRMSPSAQSMLMASILAGFTSSAILLIESTRAIGTGIGNEFLFLIGVCSSRLSKGSLVLNVLDHIFPRTQALRLHILLQDGFYLALVNLTIVIFLIIILEGSVQASNFRTSKAAA
jgi:hypothetical protein